jgi:hypothetical protein
VRPEHDFESRARVVEWILRVGLKQVSGNLGTARGSAIIVLPTPAFGQHASALIEAGAHASELTGPALGSALEAAL